MNNMHTLLVLLSKRTYLGPLANMLDMESSLLDICPKALAASFPFCGQITMIVVITWKILDDSTVTSTSTPL